MPMHAVYLVDLVGDVVGHYHIMKALHTIPSSIEFDTKEVKYHMQSPFKLLSERIRIINSVRNSLGRNDIQPSVIHFITADKYYFLPFLFGRKFEKHKIIATLHRIPNNKVLCFLLKCFSHRVSIIIVLSEYLRKGLSDIGINNVEVIPHPAFYDCTHLSKSIKEKYGLQNNDIIFSVLGGTRQDKGIDIAIEAFRQLPDNYKKQFVLNVAGKEQDFTREYIKAKSIEYGFRLLDNIRSLSDDEFKENIAISDYILIPYRKTFNGVSGPMSEAFGNGIPCILPSHGIFKLYGIKQNAELVFESENPSSLAHCIINAVEKQIKADSDFCKQFHLNNFISKHCTIYENVWNNR